jgi:altronate hydrolase
MKSPSSAGHISSSGSLADVALRLHARDDVAIAKQDLPCGSTYRLDAGGDGGQLTLTDDIPQGHKLALHAIQPGEAVKRYGQIIGFAMSLIQPGAHVHTHNLGIQEFDRQITTDQDTPTGQAVQMDKPLTFDGYLRPDGRAGTRNYLAIISTVNCSAHVCREIARYFTPERLGDYPNVDGVIALTHGYGCATRIGSQDYDLLQRTLVGMAVHPNVGAYLLVGLGCESNQPLDMLKKYPQHSQNIASQQAPPVLMIQEIGGVRKTIQAGIEAVQQLLPQVNAVSRTAQPLSKLMLALQCGGSDAWSGVTANPMVGLVADKLVAQGGTIVLGETTEIFGAEHLLAGRAVDLQVRDKLFEMVRWWQDYAVRTGVEIDDNRSVGNAAGGLTTIYEKSLGAVAKAGSSPLRGVYDYAEQVSATGFTFMNTPGYDPVGVTGQVAGGCNLVLFTTGRGSVFGFYPAPSIKISTNSELYHRMEDDMDLDAGVILNGAPMEDVAQGLFDLVIAVASGQASKSEAQGIGEAEFVPWRLSGTL